MISHNHMPGVVLPPGRCAACDLIHETTKVALDRLNEEAGDDRDR